MHIRVLTENFTSECTYVHTSCRDNILNLLHYRILPFSCMYHKSQVKLATQNLFPTHKFLYFEFSIIFMILYCISSARCSSKAVY